MKKGVVIGTSVTLIFVFMVLIIPEVASNPVVGSGPSTALISVRDGYVANFGVLGMVISLMIVLGVLGGRR